jgi:hypothetical protein
MLLRDDQTIKRTRNEDQADLARRARVTASAGEGAERVIDGWLRDVPDKKGNPVEIHRWTAPVGSWIQLEWDNPQRVSSVQITFDSGFQRELTLSSSEGVTRGTVRAAQPETVRDYTVAVRAGGQFREVARVAGNHQRVNRHRFESAVEADAVRIQVGATNGLDEARVFEVRCYG